MCHDVASVVAALWSEVDDVVGTLDDIHVMLHDEYGMTTFDETVEGAQQQADIMKMKSCGRLIKYK